MTKIKEFTDHDHRRTIGLKKKKTAEEGGTVNPSAVWSRAAAVFKSKLQGAEDATRLLEESDGADD